MVIAVFTVYCSCLVYNLGIIVACAKIISVVAIPCIFNFGNSVVEVAGIDIVIIAVNNNVVGNICLAADYKMGSHQGKFAGAAPFADSSALAVLRVREAVVMRLYSDFFGLTSPMGQC